MSMIFQEAMRHGKCQTNPARLGRLRREDNARIRFITYEEEEIIRQVILQRCPTHEPSFILALKTGMRLNEQHTLTWPQIDLPRRQITLDFTKNGSRRTVVLTERAVEPFRSIKRQKVKVTTDGVLLTRYGLALDNPKAWFRLVMRDAVALCPALLDVTWHVFRHTNISRWSWLESTCERYRS